VRIASTYFLLAGSMGHTAERKLCSSSGKATIEMAAVQSFWASTSRRISPASRSASR
jgi:hypothetical protein